MLAVTDLTVRPGDEPRLPDLALADALGFAKPRDIRELIDRNMAELAGYGEVCRTVRQTSSAGGRPGREYHLNEGQALLLCALARTEMAARVRRELIAVFMAHRRGELAPAAPLPDRDAVLALRDSAEALLALARGMLGTMPAAGGVAALPPGSGGPIDRFIAERMQLSPGARVSSAAVHRAACQWAAAAGEEGWRPKGLGTLLKARGFRAIHSNGTWWVDCRLALLEVPAGPPAPLALPRPSAATVPSVKPPSGFLYGAAAIGRYLGLDRRQVFHLVDRHGLPVVKIGRRVTARCEKIDAWYASFGGRA